MSLIHIRADGTKCIGTTVLIPEDLKIEAKARKVNFSHTIERALREELNIGGAI